MIEWLRSLFGRFAIERRAARSEPANAPFSIDFSAPVAVYDMSSPDSNWRDNPQNIQDPQRLLSIEDARCEEWFCDPFVDDKTMAPLAKILSGGQLTFSYHADSRRIRFRVSFGATRRLTDEEAVLLKDYVHGQLLDGIGENFQQSYACGRTYAETQRGLGSRMWLAFEKLQLNDIEMKVSGPPDDARWQADQPK